MTSKSSSLAQSSTLKRVYPTYEIASHLPNTAIARPSI